MNKELVKKMVSRFLVFIEIARWVCVAIGVQLAYGISGSPVDKFSILCIWVVVPLTGLTGIESVFFGKIASTQTGYGEGGAYQRQSGLNNLATAIATLIVYALNLGVYAKVAVMIVALTFFVLSALNHIYSGIYEANLKIKNIVVRPLGIALLLVVILPFLINVIRFMQI